MCCFFFFNDTATTEIYTLSLHDALPIFGHGRPQVAVAGRDDAQRGVQDQVQPWRRLEQQSEVHRTGRLPAHLAQGFRRSEEHTSELQSRQYLVCRLLLEKKNKIAIEGSH